MKMLKFMNKIHRFLVLSCLCNLLVIRKRILAQQFSDMHLTLNFVLENKKSKSTALVKLDRVEAAQFCVIRCMTFRKKCRSVNYNTVTKQCELLAENIDRFEESKFNHVRNWVYYGNRAPQFECLKDESSITKCCFPSETPMVCNLPSSCQEIQENCPKCKSELYKLKSMSVKFCNFQGLSCKELKAKCPNCPSGEYLSHAEKTDEFMFCDMETDNGGWTRVARFQVSREDENKALADVQKETLNETTESIRVNGNGALSVTGLNQLMNEKPFSEILFSCSKEWHQRKLRVVLFNKEQVERLVSGTPSPNMAVYKDIDYRFLTDDTSNMSIQDSFISGKIYNHALYRENGEHVHIYSWDRIECDDFLTNVGFQRKGIWMYFVR